MSRRRIPVGIGLPQIGDGHQFRVLRPQELAAAEDAIRIVLVEEAATTVCGRRVTRLAPPALFAIPPGHPARLRLGRGAFCYRFDLDGGPALAALLGDDVRWWHGDGLVPWRDGVAALAQRWWRSFADRRRVAIALADLLARATDDAPLPADAPLDVRFQALLRDQIGSGGRGPELARRLGVSRATLDRALVRGTGRTAAAWLRSERLRLAAERLATEQAAVAEIGAACGFADPDSFARAFRRQHGCTPTSWRQRHRRR